MAGVWSWVTTGDHKRIGILYGVSAFVFLLVGGIEALLIRLQLPGPQQTLVGARAFNALFTMHGTTMVFLAVMPANAAFFNYIVPLMLGARDVAFPRLNALSYWIFLFGALFLNASFLVGAPPDIGWFGYANLTSKQFTPGPSADFWILSLLVLGVSSMIAAVNFIVTILNMRAPGMTLMRMPIFAWTTLASMLLVIFAFPILTATLGLLALDRTLGMHFFTTDLGGSAMMYVNLIWAWGHPEVYILILPAFGIFSEIVPVFSQKRLFGYTSMVVATMAIAVLSFVVWVHHFFTMGAGANVNAFFGIMTMVIAIPTGVKVFNWLFTMFRGRIVFATPMLWFMGFLATFILGGMTGVLMSIPGIDFALHNSLFLVAHFHNMIIGGVLFGFFAGFAYWFPKLFGFMLDEKWGKRAFWCWLVGFLVAFMPLYALGLMGATRRLNVVDPSWQPLFIVAAVGVCIIGLGVLSQAVQMYVSIRDRKHNPAGNDPWGSSRTLEWLTASPPPHYNFASIPVVHSRDPLAKYKQDGGGMELPPAPETIEVPASTPMGFIVAMFAALLGFCIIWHIWWLAALAGLAIVVCLVARSFTGHIEHSIRV